MTHVKILNISLTVQFFLNAATLFLVIIEKIKRQFWKDVLKLLIYGILASMVALTATLRLW
jgi:NADH:ubiquinone oxidoreductase subunit K